MKLVKNLCNLPYEMRFFRHSISVIVAVLIKMTFFTWWWRIRTILDYKCAFVRFLIQFISCEERRWWFSPKEKSRDNHTVSQQQGESSITHKKERNWREMGYAPARVELIIVAYREKRRRNMTCSVPDWFSDPLQRGMAPSWGLKRRALLTHFFFFLWIIDRDNSRSGRGRYIRACLFPFT